MASSITKAFIAPPTLSERITREEDFFSRGFVMSYSGLNKLVYSPALFYQHYVLNQREDTTDISAIEGSLIHCLLLKPESFDDEYVLSVQNLPNDNQRKVIDMLYAHVQELQRGGGIEPGNTLNEYKNALIDILKDMNLYQTLKTDEQRLEKVINSRTVEYFDMLINSSTKTIISHDTYNFCKSVVDKITSNPAVMNVMGYFADSFNGITKFNEIELAAMPEEYAFGLRGFIDNLVFDPMTKTIRVNDVKKTSKALSNFTDSIEYYNYWMQAAMYHILVESSYKSIPAYADWNIEFRFIVIDPYMQIAPIKVSDATMQTWIEKTREKLNEANHHFTTRRFDLPYQFLLNDELVL